jgi:hypothetical protein
MHSESLHLISSVLLNIGNLIGRSPNHGGFESGERFGIGENTDSIVPPQLNMRYLDGLSKFTDTSVGWTGRIERCNYHCVPRKVESLGPDEKHKVQTAQSHRQMTRKYIPIGIGGGKV